MQIAPSGYRRHAARKRNPDLRCARARRDETLILDIQRVWKENMSVYGADKVWKQMNRENIPVARCTVERLMKRLGLEGVRRGRKLRTTIPDPAIPCPLDHVNRKFRADRPNQLWVSDFTLCRPGRGGYMWLLSSMCLPGASWAGESASPCRRISFWMRWNKPCMPDNRPGRN